MEVKKVELGIFVVLMFVILAFFGVAQRPDAPDQSANLELQTLQEANLELIAAKEHEFYRGVYATCTVILYKQRMPKEKIIPFCLTLAASAEKGEAHKVELPEYDGLKTGAGTAPQQAPTPRPDRPKPIQGTDKNA
jgi:hypothetical protein